MTPQPRSPRGVTLLELLVTMSILAALSAVTTLGVRRITAPRPDDPRTILANGIRQVLATGRATTLHFVIDGLVTSATVLPDGSVVADSALALERLTGIPARAKP